MTEPADNLEAKDCVWSQMSEEQRADANAIANRYELLDWEMFDTDDELRAKVDLHVVDGQLYTYKIDKVCCSQRDTHGHRFLMCCMQEADYCTGFKAPILKLAACTCAHPIECCFTGNESVDAAQKRGVSPACRLLQQKECD